MTSGALNRDGIPPMSRLALMWAVASGQFKDVEQAKYRMLEDGESAEKGAAENKGDSGEKCA